MLVMRYLFLNVSAIQSNHYMSAGPMPKCRHLDRFVRCSLHTFDWLRILQSQKSLAASSLYVHIENLNCINCQQHQIMHAMYKTCIAMWWAVRLWALHSHNPLNTHETHAFTATVACYRNNMSAMRNISTTSKVCPMACPPPSPNHWNIDHIPICPDICTQYVRFR